MTTRLSLSGLILAAAMSAGLPALAETTPGRGAHDSRVRIATWVDGQVFRVVTSLTRVTTVEFGEGETIRSIIAGDTVGFQFDAVPGGRAFAIKPVASGVATNITVYTNRRSYYFHVVEARETPHYVVQFRYPESRNAPRQAVAAAARRFSPLTVAIAGSCLRRMTFREVITAKTGIQTLYAQNCLYTFSAHHATHT